MKSLMRYKSVQAALLVLSLGTVSCKASNSNENAAPDLAAAFQAGCSSTGTANAQIALNQTQSLLNTIADLRTKNQCQGLDQAQAAISNINSQIYALQQDPNTLAINALEGAQSTLLAQINETTDPTSLEILTETYSANALEIASLQAEEQSLSGSPFTTNVQRGYSTLSSYINALSGQASNINDCAHQNPDFAAKLGAQLMSVSGNFFSPAIGTAITLVGAVVDQVISQVDDNNYAKTINSLNVSQMTTALSCSLESMTGNYCEAEDAMALAKFAECERHPGINSFCPAKPNASTLDEAVVSQFWQGIDVLSRSVPALQIWTAKVVSGVTPSDIYEAQKQNDLITARAGMDVIKRLAEGEEAYEKGIIDNPSLNPIAKRQEMVNALKQLQTILSTGSASASSNFLGSGPTSSITPYFSSSQILYLLVGKTYDCQDSTFGSTCNDTTNIPMPGDTGSAPNLANDGSGWDIIIRNENALFSSVYNQIQSKLQAVDNADPSGVLEAVKIPAGTGLPTPFEALNNINNFLKVSLEFYTNVPAQFLDGGEAGRPKTLALIVSTQKMINAVLMDVIAGAQVPSTDPTAPAGTLVLGTDAQTLSDIYEIFQLGQDPNFIAQRLTLHVQEDLGTRIKAKKIPKNASDILYANRTDPTDQLSAFASDDQVDATKSSLATAITSSELNTQNFVKFFIKSLSNTLNLLKVQADAHGEPMGGTPDQALYRSQLAKICILITSSQLHWPSNINVNVCKGTFMQSESGQKIAFDDLFAVTQQPEDGSGKMCSIYRFYRKKPVQY